MDRHLIGIINVKDYDVTQAFKTDQPFTRSATQIEARKRRIESEKYYFEVCAGCPEPRLVYNTSTCR